MTDDAARPGRLLFVVNEALFFTTHRQPIAEAMQARGWRVDVAAPTEDGQARARIEAAGFTFHPIPLDRGGRDPRAEWRLYRAIARLYADLKPDLVHLVSMKPTIWGGIAARLAGVPAVVAAITGLGYLFIREGAAAEAQRQILVRLYRAALAHRNLRVVFQNDDDAGEFFRRRLVTPDKAVMIRGCGVDMTRFAATPEPAGRPVVMFPARLIGDKGVHEFVAAARALKPRHPDVRFVLVGRDDPLNPTALSSDAIAELSSGGIVEWWGFSADMPRTLAEANLIVLPSYREGLPRGLIEAAACGRAIVTTDVPGCRDVVRHEVNGLLVPARDGVATAAAIARLLDDPALRTRLAEAGRRIAVTEFSVEGFVEASLAAYQAVLHRPV